MVMLQHAREPEIIFQGPIDDVETPQLADIRLHGVHLEIDRAPRPRMPGEDDLPDFGAYIFAETIRQIHEQVPGCSVEVLVPDFQGSESSIATVLDARPEIYNHNTETVPRLYKKARPGGRYHRVMEIFRFVKRAAPDIPTKTGMILGMGETIEEVLEVMRDLRAVDVDILTLGQYLRPSSAHIALDRYYAPAEFKYLREEGMQMGFRHVESGPLVRSSYHAWEQVQAAGV